MKKQLWMELIKELRLRGKGIQESGAFLLGKLGDNEIIEFKCYDDFDRASFGKYITFEGSAYSLLWAYCIERNLTVLADVHTHPYDWTGQSQSDKQNPMISQIGHLALIIPYYAKGRRHSLKGVGFYQYLGDKQWKILNDPNDAIKIIK